MKVNSNSNTLNFGAPWGLSLRLITTASVTVLLGIIVFGETACLLNFQAPLNQKSGFPGVQ